MVITFQTEKGCPRACRAPESDVQWGQEKEKNMKLQGEEAQQNWLGRQRGAGKL